MKTSAPRALTLAACALMRVSCAPSAIAWLEIPSGVFQEISGMVPWAMSHFTSWLSSGAVHPGMKFWIAKFLPANASRDWK